MISIGSNIQSASDPLQRVEIDYLFNSLKNPKKEIEAQISRLRTVRAVDAKLYSKLKVGLPYFVCGCFNPSYRKKENFSYTEFFIIDLDNLGSHSMNIDEVRKKLQADSRVLMCFKSPSEDGLKVLFKLKERCFDPTIYSQFYKIFASAFSRQYDIADVVDYKTCDVSRACFISIDSEAYYNPDADPVDLTAFWNPIDVFEANKEQNAIKEVESQDILAQNNIDNLTQHNPDPDQDTMDRIKAVLFEKQKKLQELAKDVYVPKEVDIAIEKIRIAALEQGIDLYEAIPIQYGKKLRFKLGSKSSEINLFFGRRGFSIVSSPRRGTSQELNDICNCLIEITLAENRI